LKQPLVDPCVDIVDCGINVIWVDCAGKLLHRDPQQLIATKNLLQIKAPRLFDRIFVLGPRGLHKEIAQCNLCQWLST
jgi:hypothetical protein